MAHATRFMVDRSIPWYGRFTVDIIFSCAGILHTSSQDVSTNAIRRLTGQTHLRIQLLHGISLLHLTLRRVHAEQANRLRLMAEDMVYGGGPCRGRPREEVDRATAKRQRISLLHIRGYSRSSGGWRTPGVYCLGVWRKVRCRGRHEVLRADRER